MTIEQVSEQVAQTVNDGNPVPAQPVVRVDTGGLTIEFDPEPYPEVRDAFDQYCKVTHTNGTLRFFEVRALDDEPKARVRATIEVGGRTLHGDGVGPDVVQAAVHAFSSAYERAA